VNQFIPSAYHIRFIFAQRNVTVMAGAEWRESSRLKPTMRSLALSLGLGHRRAGSFIGVHRPGVERRRVHLRCLRFSRIRYRFVARLN
jgi:hypothetical protein